MLSAMFRRDYAAMAAEGLAPSPEDVVRLNALAVRVRLSADAAVSSALPRAAFMPRDSRWRRPLVLREPTLAHEMWTEEALRLFGGGEDARAWLLVEAFALARGADALPSVRSPGRLVRAVARFAARRLSSFTREQLSCAVEWCLFGADWTAGERGGEPRARKPEDGLAARAEGSPFLGVFLSAKACRVPLTLDEARLLTASEVAEVVRAALAADGLFDADAAKSSALADYCRARDEIRARLRAVRDGEAAADAAKAEGGAA